MTFLGLKIACSVLLALVLKHCDRLGLNRLGLIRANYAAAAIIAFLLVVARNEHTISKTTTLVAVLAGVSYVAALVLWARAISERGIALTVGFTRMSVVIPMLFSALVWKEIPHWYQVVGILLGLVALGMVGRQAGRADPEPEAEPAPARRTWTVILLFVASGIAGLSSKLFDELCPAAENLQFQTVLFVTAFVATTFLYYRQKTRVDQSSLQWGALLGGVNLGSSIFMILALVPLSGTVAFPISAAVEVAVIALLGRLIWRERLTRLSVVGLILTVIALVLVQIG